MSSDAKGAVGGDGEPVRRGSLTVVGTGLQAGAHLTAEARAGVERAEKLFYLAVDPATARWLESLNPTAESLADAYAEGKPLAATYDEAADRIVAAVVSGLDVCAAFYGHPGLFCAPSRRALRRVRRAGHPARMLPGISSVDCLFCDLDVDPGVDGCQIFEATSFLIRRLRFDPTVHLVLLQAGLLGGTAYSERELWNRDGLGLLARTLGASYPDEHPAVVYEAARFAVGEPRIERVALSELAEAGIDAHCTLYLPPRPRRPVDRRIADELGMPAAFGGRRR